MTSNHHRMSNHWLDRLDHRHRQKMHKRVLSEYHMSMSQKSIVIHVPEAGEDYCRVADPTAPPTPQATDAVKGIRL